MPKFNGTLKALRENLKLIMAVVGLVFMAATVAINARATSQALVSHMGESDAIHATHTEDIVGIEKVQENQKVRVERLEKDYEQIIKGISDVHNAVLRMGGEIRVP